MSTDERMDRYAKLAIEVGVNLQPGQDLLVEAAVEHAPLARRLARAAYAAGGRYVDVHYTDRHLLRAQVELGAEEGLGWTPSWAVRRMEEASERRACLLGIQGGPDPELMAGLDGGRLARAQPVELARAAVRLLDRRLIAWSIIACPTPGWAASVYGEPDLDRLWRDIETVVRLDTPDPVAAWRDHVDRLRERARALTERHFDAMRFRGPGTDLVVGLLPGSRWEAAEFETAWGQVTVPNLPTEEVFTTPDRRRADGVVRSTRPLPFAGTEILDLSVTLSGGRVTDVRARAGEDAFRQIVATDEGAASLGEMALVDGTSRVGRLGHVFHNVLLDENAACHIAVGRGLASVVEGADGLEEDGLRELGVNVSVVHVDFMVGSPEMEVHGLEAGGAAVPVLEGNEWRL